MKKKIPAKRKLSADKTFIGLTYFLLLFGSLMIYNSTVIYSQNIYGNAYKFAFLHLGWLALGLVGFVFFLSFDYKKLIGWSYFLFSLSLIFLFVLAIFGLIPCESSSSFAPCVNGANRWFYLNPKPLPEIPLLGVFGFQPSEFAKFALIIYLASQITRNLSRKVDSFTVYAVSTFLTAGLILMQPNMSTAAIIIIIGTVVYFASGAPLKPFVYLTPVIIAVVVLAMLVSPYRRERLFTLLERGQGRQEMLESGYHINQVSIALGSGGIFGIGFGQSRQKYQYLPEVASDSIFAIIGEEFGYIGTLAVTSVFMYYIYRGILIAKKSEDLLGKLLVIGVISWIGIQFLVNVSAMARIIPLTGIPIPLISYGGSSLVFSLMGLGIVGNVSRQSNDV